MPSFSFSPFPHSLCSPNHRTTTIAFANVNNYNLQPAVLTLVLLVYASVSCLAFLFCSSCLLSTSPTSTIFALSTSTVFASPMPATFDLILLQWVIDNRFLERQNGMMVDGYQVCGCFLVMVLSN